VEAQSGRRIDVVALEKAVGQSAIHLREPLDKRRAEDLFKCHELAADGGQGETRLTACS
jgi:hypothetical protein